MVSPRAALALALGVLLSCAAAAGDPAPPPGWDAALKASQAVIGQPLPETVTAAPMLDSRQRSVRLATWRGKPLVVSFVYTGCFQACPVATKGLERAVRAAREALGSDSFEVVTIGFNQPFDDPVAMGAFARQARIDEPRWHFVSPRKEDVDALGRAFGFTWAPTPKGFDHVTQATIVDAEGRIYRQVYGEVPEIAQFVGPLKELLTGQAREQGSLDGLWRTVKLYCTVYDPVSGGYRLNYSLFVELFAGLTMLGGLGWYMRRHWRRTA